MEFTPEKLLVVESDDALRENIVAALSDAGYEVSTDYQEGIKSVLAFRPDVVIFGADPPQLDCCDLLSEIKGSEHTQNIRVIMLAHGGHAERSRGMDRGADAVPSLPFDTHELLSRVRWQLRDEKKIERLQQQATSSEENRRATKQLVSEERRTLRVGGLLVAAALIVAIALVLTFYHRTQEQN